MPFVSIRIAGTASREQKAGIVADVTSSLAARLDKNPAAVQIVIEEVSTENYAAAGQLMADRPNPGDAPPAQGDAHAVPGR